MIRYTLRALRQQQREWLGTLCVLAFAATLVNVCLAHRGSVTRPDVVAAGRAAGVSPAQLEMSGTSVYIYSALVAIPVIAIVGQSCVEALQTTWARWRLAGASQQQVFSSVLALVSIIGIVASVPGVLLGLVLDQRISSVLTTMATTRMGPIKVIQTPTTVALTVLSIVAVALVGAIGPARTAVRTPASEALRASNPTRRRMGISRWVATVVWFLFCVFQIGIAFSIQPIAQKSGLPAGSGQGMLAGLLIGVLGVLCAPTLIPLLMSWWAKPLSLLGSTWLLAHRSAGWRSGLAASAIALLGLSFSFTASLMTGLFTNEEAARAVNIVGGINQVDTIVMAAVLGAMALLGSIAVVGMTSRAREREFALLRCSGSIIGSVRLQAVIEAGLYVGTALMLAVVPLVVSTVGEWYFFRRAGIDIDMTPGLGPLAAVVVSALVCLGAVLVLPVRNAYGAPIGPTLSPE